MPAQIESMAYVRAVPWHGLGTKLDGLQTAAEMLVGAGLDWTVAQSPLSYVFSGEHRVQYPGRLANVRQSDGAALGIVGDNYQIVQNRDAFAWADTLVDDGSAKYETAGSLMGGRRVFLSMELPQGIRVPGDDGEVKPYLLVTNGHDGSTILQASVTMVRVVCANTWTLALRGASRTFKIRHTGSVEGKLAAARQALGITFEYAGEFERIASALAMREVSNRQVEQILAKAFSQGRDIEDADKVAASPYGKVLDLYRSAPDLDPIRGTAWGVLQAAGAYVDHEVAYHGRTWPDEDVRMDSILYDGPAAQAKQRVYDLVAAK